jgi:hypothetical protein
MHVDTIQANDFDIYFQAQRISSFTLPQRLPAVWLQHDVIVYTEFTSRVADDGDHRLHSGNTLATKQLLQPS